MTRTIAILGGSFNPVTNGHLAVANCVLKSIRDIECVYLMPANKHMFGKENEYWKNRLDLLKLVETDRIKVFTYEIDNNLNGSTYETMKMLKSDPEYKDTNFLFIVGSDCLSNLHRWKNIKGLGELVDLVVVKREGFSIEPEDLSEQQKEALFCFNKFIMLDCATESFSSTQVRKVLTSGGDISKMVPHKVFEAIHANLPSL
jgi:nicotinate-nucleotide adenylyltransferase